MNLSSPARYNVLIDETTGDRRAARLLSAAKSGDSRAFVELCEPHFKKILAKLYSIMKNREDAEDALQDTLLQAFIHIEQFEGRSSFSSWLTRIAINQALMALRKRRRLTIQIDHVGDDSDTWQNWELWVQTTETPESYYVQLEREEMLRVAILSLSPTFREVLEMRHAQSRSPIEIARALGISLPAVKSRLSRARKAVATVLEKAV
jgi:RNA polymerase sigma-70 factor (ECF subfamily)